MSKALIVIDVQNDFCPGGALAVSDGDAVVPVINAMMEDFDTVLYTQDWHPENHLSFADNHPGAEPFSTTVLPYGTQVLWPAHCVQGTDGAAFHKDLRLMGDLVIRKGFRPEIDSYSAFFENDQTTRTGLAGYLRDRGITELTFAGLATDFCVAWSALDAVKEGFSATVRMDACRAIDLDGSLDAAVANLKSAGVTLA
ncbi:bifunctional nicotinamidase/pyrazinamidase [Oceanibium sediminis]|uniref:bifunctional nicotinamidase/pyrazinamidase n=1 Tax=Oceanibium sediminis TaxID=2026339 RepID=UPI000DD347CE|nr:bifunctional nicotinamidase/pyrazinamidase [Oceanibium sediminis]